MQETLDALIDSLPGSGSLLAVGTQRSKKRVVRAELSVKRLVSNLLSALFAHAK